MDQITQAIGALNNDSLNELLWQFGDLSNAQKTELLSLCNQCHNFIGMQIFAQYISARSIFSCFKQQDASGLQDLLKSPVNIDIYQITTAKKSLLTLCCETNYVSGIEMLMNYTKQKMHDCLVPILTTQTFNPDIRACLRNYNAKDLLSSLRDQFNFIHQTNTQVQDMTKFVAENQFDMNHKHADGETPLIIAAKYGNDKIVKILIDNHFDKLCYSVGMAIETAVLYKNFNIVQQFIGFDNHDKIYNQFLLELIKKTINKSPIIDLLVARYYIKSGVFAQELDTYMNNPNRLKVLRAMSLNKALPYLKVGVKNEENKQPEISLATMNFTKLFTDKLNDKFLSENGQVPIQHALILNQHDSKMIKIEAHKSDETAINIIKANFDEKSIDFTLLANTSGHKSEERSIILGLKIAHFNRLCCEELKLTELMVSVCINRILNIYNTPKTIKTILGQQAKNLVVADDDIAILNLGLSYNPVGQYHKIKKNIELLKVFMQLQFELNQPLHIVPIIKEDRTQKVFRYYFYFNLADFSQYMAFIDKVEKLSTHFNRITSIKEYNKSSKLFISVNKLTLERILLYYLYVSPSIGQQTLGIDTEHQLKESPLRTETRHCTKVLESIPENPDRLSDLAISRSFSSPIIRQYRRTELPSPNLEEEKTSRHSELNMLSQQMHNFKQGLGRSQSLNISK